jgi:arabinose-5-phosphate isomerase
MMIDAVAIMADRKISELPVIDAADRPRGLIDITDVLGLFPEAAPPADEQSETPGVAKFPTARI